VLRIYARDPGQMMGAHVPLMEWWKYYQEDKYKHFDYVQAPVSDNEARHQIKFNERAFERLKAVRAYTLEPDDRGSQIRGREQG
jgi:hypothetical protein